MIGIRTKPWRFHLFGFPVQVDLSFFLIALILGLRRSDLTLLAIWVAVVFVSVLAHELGHAAMGKRYGMFPRIELYSGGGLTWWQNPTYPPGVWHQPGYPSHTQKIAISLAGPITGFIIGGIVWWVRQLITPYMLPWHIRVLMSDLMWVNVGWGILNLLPVLPLDGGNVMRSAIHHSRGYDDDVLPLKISCVAGIIVAGAALFIGLVWGAVLFGWFAYINYQQLQHKGFPY